MSRLAGFSFMLDDEEIGGVIWKNYLEIDTLIIQFLGGRHAIKQMESGTDDLKVTFNVDQFKPLYTYLKNMLTPTYWKNDDILMYDVERAEKTWDHILNKMERILTALAKYPETQIVAEFFECS